MSIPNIYSFATPAPYVWTQDPFLQEWGPLLQRYQSPLDKSEIIHLLQQLYSKLDANSRHQLATISFYASDPKVFLGTLLAACHHNLPEVTRLLTQTEPLDCIGGVYNLYFGSIFPATERWVVSFPGKADQELLYTMELARLLAHDLIDDTGAVNRGLAQFLNCRIPIQFATLPELYKKQLGIVMDLLEKDDLFNQILLQTGSPHPTLHEDVLMALRESHLRREGLTSTHSKRAILGALLSYPRQEAVYGDCFIQSLIIGLLQHNPTLILAHLGRYVSTGIFPTPSPIPYIWRDTFHCSYETQVMTGEEILRSPIFPSLFSGDLPALAHPNPLSPSSPIEEIHRMTSRLFPREDQPDEVRECLRQGLNRLASYFLHPLLHRLANHAKVLGDNFIGLHRGQLFRQWAQLFIEFPQLLPLKKAFFSYLEQHLLVRRIDDEFFLKKLELLGVPRASILSQGGELCCFDSTQNMGFRIETVEQLRDKFLEILREARKNAPLLPDDVFAPLEQPAFLLWLKKAALRASRGPDFYPQEIFQSPFCYLSILGGVPGITAREVFGVSLKDYPLLGEKPQEVLLYLGTCFRQELNRRDPNPLVIGEHYSSYPSEGHAYTVFPYNSTLRQLWETASPREKIEAMMREIERRGKIPLTETQKNFLTLSISTIFKEDPPKIIRAIYSFSEGAITPDGAIRKWCSNLPRENVADLQMALNEAMELLPWEFWRNEMSHIGDILTHFPPQVGLPKVIENLLNAIASANQDPSLPFGMPLHRGAQVIHKTLQNLGFSLEYGQLLNSLCKKYGFPLRFQMGDMNWAASLDKKELWIVPNYGNLGNPLRYAYSDGRGGFNTEWVSPFNHHSLHILEKTIF